MNILFYTPLNTRSRDIESQAGFFCRAGHSIFLLTQNNEGPLHQNFSAYGYKTDAYLSASRFTWMRILMHTVYLVYCCYRNRIDIVYSHLEPCNFIAVLAQFLVRSKVIICRHHVDEAQLYGFGRDLSYRLTYRLARNIIVVSDHARRYMIEKEGVSPQKITHINLAYDLGLYELPDPEKVKELRASFHTDLLLLDVCRLTSFKRPQLCIEVLKQVRNHGLNAKFVILGRGEMGDELQRLIDAEHLNGLVILAGYVTNVLEYMAAADFLVHPSLLESSCISVKEAGLVKLPVLVCRGIGDFDEVISHQNNGFLIDPDNFAEDATALILKYHKDKTALARMGDNLNQTVYRLFDIHHVGPLYEKYFHRKA